MNIYATLHIIMDIFLQILLLVSGLAVAIFGTNILIRGASSIAKPYNVSDWVIGATIVGFGSSMPECAVNVTSAIHGHTDIAISNILGSNIFNCLYLLYTNSDS